MFWDFLLQLLLVTVSEPWNDSPRFWRFGIVLQRCLGLLSSCVLRLRILKVLVFETCFRLWVLGVGFAGTSGPVRILG